ALDVICSSGSLLAEVVFGSFRTTAGEAPTKFPPEAFQPNPKFVQVLHGFLVETVPRQAGFGAEAAQGGGDGWVTLIDLRTADPNGEVPLGDLLGGFEFKGGRLAGYRPDPRHPLHSRRRP